MPGNASRPRATARLAVWIGLFAAVMTGLGLAGPGGRAQAQIGSDRYASLVIEAQSGNVLSAANLDEFRYPASLTKLMTIYMLFEGLRDHRIAFTDQVPVSASAASMPPTKLGLLPGMSITVEQALLGLVTKSANDAAAALGEMMGGDEEKFAEMMTLRAHALGMSRTTFRNASGLPDWGQVTTAHDIALLARHLIQDFPSYYSVFSTPSFQFHGRTVYNHQRMLQTYPGADGLKTGYIEASGYNLVTSAMRGNVRLIGVVLGAANGGERDQHMASLLDQGFERMGVAPVEVARREPERFNLFGTAHAAPLPSRYAPLQVAEARPPRPRHGRPSAQSRLTPVRRPAEWHPVRPLRPLAAARRTGYGVYDPPRPPRVRPLRAGGTRTAHSPGWGRYPG